MYCPQKQQIEICLLKSNLEEIENNLIEQRSAIPALDAENEKKYRETMTALRTARTLNDEMERLKQDSVRLTARRVQVKRQTDDVTAALQDARERRESLMLETQREEHEAEKQIRRYEDALRDIADRFRSSRVFYDENKLNSEIEIITSINAELKNEEIKRHNEITELKYKLENLHTEIPEDILSIIGKTELEIKLKALSTQIEALHSERDNLLKCRLNTSVINRNY